MNWNDLESAWKRQALPAGATADLATLQASFESKRRRMAVTLLLRDLLEAGAGVFVAGVLGALWWRLGAAAWPLSLAIALLLGLSGFFVRERLRTRRLRLGPGAPVLAKIAADLAELRHQRRLLLHVAWWYLAPCLAAIVIAGLTLLSLLPPHVLHGLLRQPAALAWVAGYVLILLPALFWGVWALNRRAVRRQIEPRIAELEKLQRELAADSVPPPQ